MRIRLLVALGVLVGLVSPGLATAGPGLVAGVVEDDVRASTLVGAEAKMAGLRLAGYRAVRVTSYWRPGLAAPTDDELRVLQNAGAAGELTGIQVYVTVMHQTFKTTPVTDEARAEFASYTAAIAKATSIRRVIVANEPNLNRFWMPQFDPDGSSASPKGYLALLAETYDAVKAVSPSTRVYGGALSPRGGDRPGGIRPTHSPTVFIRQLGIAYRASGRDRPVMDALTHHPYPDNSSQSPTFGHPNTTTIGVADYGKLVALLGEAFDGTAQPGTQLPIMYTEFGVESEIPPAKASLYTGTEPSTTKPVSETTQAAYYEQALALAFCQPTVEGMLLFLSRDERARPAWQSGLHYVDGTPKSSRARVTEALDRSTGGSITRCPGVQLKVRTTYLRFGTPWSAKRGVFKVSFRCDLDCAYRVRLENAVTHITKLGTRGVAEVGELVEADLGYRALGPGTYRYTISLVHPVNPAPPTERTGPTFALPKP